MLPSREHILIEPLPVTNCEKTQWPSARKSYDKIVSQALSCLPGCPLAVCRKSENADLEFLIQLNKDVPNFCKSSVGARLERSWLVLSNLDRRRGKKRKLCSQVIHGRTANSIYDLKLPNTILRGSYISSLTFKTQTANSFRTLSWSRCLLLSASYPSINSCLTAGKRFTI